uniref:Basic leucine zipper domain-containing protein n=1 Tax=Globodera rostochiensis TaxID=31243 RepID=A0A914GWS7_GLORO
MEATGSKVAPSSASTGVFVAHFLSGLSPENVPHQPTPSTLPELSSSFFSSGPNLTPTALIPPTKHFDQLEKQENSNGYLMNQWNRSFVPPEVNQRLLSSPESVESSQSFPLKNGKKQSARRSLSSELERSATDAGAVLMADWELTRLTVRELNQRLVGQNRSVVSALKQKRRTLKNRGYALNCRTRRMRNQQQLEAENVYLRQLVAKQSALLAKYEQKLVGRETGKADNDNVEGGSSEKWPEEEGVSPRQNNNASSPVDGAGTSVKSLTNSSSAQMPTAHFRQYNGTVNSSSPQQQELFYPIVYQQQQQFPTTELQFPYYPVFRGNGAQEAAAQFQNWNQFQ